MSKDWSRQEVEATVADYLAMLDLELRGVPFVKIEHIRRLTAMLGGRSEQAVQYKYGNISAVLQDIGLPFVDGFKPYSNYQQLLFDVVCNRIPSGPLLALVREQVEERASPVEVSDVLAALVVAPESGGITTYPKAKGVNYVGNFKPVDYLEREAHNRSLGSAGEEFALRFEQARLSAAGRDHLADRVERVSATQGDWLGFDIKSYEIDGSDRFVEVKTTRYGKRTPFFASRNEVNTSIEHGDRYQLLRIFDFHQEPKLFNLTGRLDHVCSLDPVSFMARVG